MSDPVQVQGGLSSPITEATTVGSTESNIPTGKTAVPKGPYALPVGGVAGAVDQGLLDNMRQLIAEREAQRNSFMEGLKDATAWWSGGMAGPAQALMVRDKQREEQDATTFGMKSQIAQYNAQQQLAKAAQADVYSALGMGPNGAPLPAGAPGAPAGGGLNTKIDPTIAAQIAAMAKTDPTGAKKELLKHTAEMAKITATAKANPESYKKTIEIKTPNGLELVSLVEFLENPSRGTPTEKGNANIETITGNKVPTGAPTTTTTGEAAKIATSLGIPLTSGTRTNDEQWKLYDDWVAGGRKGPVVARPGSSKHEVGNAIDVDMKKATPDQLQVLRDKGFKQTVASEPWHWELTSAPATTAVPAPVATTAPTVAPTTTPAAMPVGTSPIVNPPATLPPATNAPFKAAPGVAEAPSFPGLPHAQPLQKIEAPVAAPIKATAPPPTTTLTAAPAQQAPTVAAPAAPVAPTTVPAAAAPAEDVSKLTIPQLRARAETEKEGDIAAAKEKATQMEKVARPVFESSINPIQLGEDAVAFDRIKRLVTTEPAIAGVISKPGYRNSIATFLKEGITTPKGTFNFGGLETAIAQSLKETTNMTLARREELASYLARMELNAAQLIAGQGAISDGERTTLKSVSLSTSNKPETIYKRMEMMERRNQLDQQIAKMYGDGTNVKNLSAFKLQIANTPEYKQYIKDIKEIANKEYDFSKAGGKPKLAHPADIQDTIKRVNAQ